MRRADFCRKYHISQSTCQRFIQNSSLQYSKESGIDEQHFLRTLKTHPERFGSSAWAMAHSSYYDALPLKLTEAEKSQIRELWKKQFTYLPDTLHTGDVAKALGYNKESVRRWIELSHLKCVCVGRHHLISKEWLLDFVCGDDYALISRKSNTHLLTLAQIAVQFYNQK
jgi:hypothetical protein